MALPQWIFGMPKGKNLSATCYYPKPLIALPGEPEGKTHNSWPDKLVVHTESGPWTIHVGAREHYLAAIEASALLDLSAFGVRGSLSIAYHNKKWWSYPWAPYGVGDRMNPLVPGRDFANNHWQFGTQLLLSPPREIEGLIRPVMYRSCKFGAMQPEHRVDLFVARPCNYYGPLRAEINYPWEGVSGKPILGAQQALNKLGYEGLNGLKLAEDNDWGVNTRHALWTWIGRNWRRFPWDPPALKVPWDAEIYYQLRNCAKTANES